MTAERAEQVPVPTLARRLRGRTEGAELAAPERQAGLLRERQRRLEAGARMSASVKYAHTATLETCPFRKSVPVLLRDELAWIGQSGLRRP